jgi:hypothetical protein
MLDSGSSCLLASMLSFQFRILLLGKGISVLSIAGKKNIEIFDFNSALFGILACRKIFSK